MINSGKFPKVAFNNPPTESLVYVARFSVEVLISLAIGIIESAAEKKIKGAEECKYSRIKVMGMKVKSQWIPGVKMLFRKEVDLLIRMNFHEAKGLVLNKK